MTNIDLDACEHKEEWEHNMFSDIKARDGDTYSVTVYVPVHCLGCPLKYVCVKEAAADTLKHCMTAEREPT